MERGKHRERYLFSTGWLSLLKPREAEHAMDQGGLWEAWSSVHQCWRSLCSSKIRILFQKYHHSLWNYFPPFRNNSNQYLIPSSHGPYSVSASSAVSTSWPFHDVLTHFTPSINHDLTTTPNQNHVWNWVPIRIPSQVRIILPEWRIKW